MIRKGTNLKIIETNSNISVEELGKLSNRYATSAKRMIVDRSKEFVDIYGGKSGKRYKLILNSKGKEFLYTIRKLLEWGEEMKEDFLIREESKPSEYGCKPEDRPITEYTKNGIIILDKWSGPTSHDASDFLRRKLELKKAANTGTLV